MDEELWDINKVMEFLECSSVRSASGTLSRWGVKAFDYKVVDGKAHALFHAGEIRRAKTNRPGRGARTDLRSKK